MRPPNRFLLVSLAEVVNFEGGYKYTFVFALWMLNRTKKISDITDQTTIFGKHTRFAWMYIWSTPRENLGCNYKPSIRCPLTSQVQRPAFF